MSARKSPMRTYLILGVIVLIIVAISGYLGFALPSLTPDTTKNATYFVGNITNKFSTTLEPYKFYVYEVNTTNGTYFTSNTISVKLSVNHSYIFTAYPTKNNRGYNGTQLWISDFIG